MICSCLKLIRIVIILLHTGRISGPILLCVGLVAFIGGIVWVRKRVAARKARERNEDAVRDLDVQLGAPASKYHISDKSLANLDSVFVTKTSAKHSTNHSYADSEASTSRPSSSNGMSSYSREASVLYSRNSGVEIEFGRDADDLRDYVDMTGSELGANSRPSFLKPETLSPSQSYQYDGDESRPSSSGFGSRPSSASRHNSSGFSN